MSERLSDEVLQLCANEEFQKVPYAYETMISIARELIELRAAQKASVPVTAVLWDLVKLKDAKERVEELSARMMTGAEMKERKRLDEYYKAGKELAWSAARKALYASAPTQKASVPGDVAWYWKAIELLRVWSDQIKECHTTPDGEWLDEQEAKAVYDEIMEVIYASAPPAEDAELRRDAERYREHCEVMRAATLPRALYIDLRTARDGQMWRKECVLDTSTFGEGTFLGVKAIGLAAEHSATELFAAIDAALSLAGR